MDLICAGTLSPRSPRPCWGLRGTEADTDRRAHPLPRRRAAVHHRIPQANSNKHNIGFVTSCTEINKQKDESVELFGNISLYGGWGGIFQTYFKHTVTVGLLVLYYLEEEY